MKKKTPDVNVVAPRSISGFPEWLPEVKILENRLLNIIRKHYESFGFVPIETPAVELCEVLTAKGGNEKEIYTLGRLRDAGTGDDTKDLALHFDLTVPLARYVAQYQRELVFPFRRYQIQKVWRGERPQSGRFREFYQCDIDVIGDETLNLLTDAEMPAVIYQIFSEMGVGPFMIRINNRKIVQGLLSWIGVVEEDFTAVMHILDDLEKLGIDRCIASLKELGISEELARKVLTLVGRKFTASSALRELESLGCSESFYLEGVQELNTVLEGVLALGVPEESFCADLSIVRGLDYYTGTVYEAILLDHPNVGSVCSGGRYENLASYFTSRKLPGVGISIGLSRLLSRLLQEKVLTAQPCSPAPVLVTSMDGQRMKDYMEMAAELRLMGIGAETYLESKKMGAQLGYASKKGFRVAIIAGSEEFESDTVVVKNLGTGVQTSVSRAELVQEVSCVLGSKT
ncbi:MAG: histidine--tRNA ligase [Candidatus Moraniibacteriota bacterium]